MESIGIDVHKMNSQICVVCENGEVIEERRIHTDRERFAAVLGKRPKARLLIEASTESEWVARCLEELGHEVIVADPNSAAMYATRTSPDGFSRLQAAYHLAPGTQVALEAGTVAFFVARQLSHLGLDPIVVDGHEVRLKAHRPNQSWVT
jgi:transposase